jgi:transcriptional regulator with XRE-family HTH domain
MSVTPEDRGEPAQSEASVPATDAERLELLLEIFRRADGERWTLREIENATGEVVSASYLSSIRKRRIKRVGARQRQAMARVMGFPIELWEADPKQWPQIMKDMRRAAESGQASGAPLADLLEDLFRFARHPLTGSAFTERTVADLSEGELTEDEVRMMRQGRITDPPEGKLLALSDVFGVPRSYWYQPRRVPLLDEDTERFLSSPSRLRALHMRLLDLPKNRREKIGDRIEELVDRAREEMEEEERRRGRADRSRKNS